ncbi:MAG: peptidoglycan DD-metalloendopeptidase family protein [Salinisphaera sp.]|jgi:murein DD-endopeptidase MepM/ murein hydrolase activator NlpD|nr:peptidoglycan DD-metalloendopeptidase family protein [Salinisphaera sp.]
MLDRVARPAMLAGMAISCLLCLSMSGLASAADASAGVSAWQKVVVKRGDTLSRIFERKRLPANAWHSVVALGDRTGVLKDIHPGDIIDISQDASGQLVGLRYKPDTGRTLLVNRVDGHLHVGPQASTGQMQKQLAAGQVRQSLPKSLASAGVPASIADKLAQIYWPRLDLTKDIQPGDHFSVLYEARYKDNNLAATGPILAARITSHGKTLSAYRALSDQGLPAYYDSNGQPYRAGISRHPVNYTRISSPFMLERMDPAVHFVHPHYGVDMAAPMGTPIRAASNGRVKYVGWMHGYGRLVELRHADGYTTRYAHLHKFVHGLHVGEYVSKGEVIGRVGSTGWSTGPHLLFEIRHHGVPHDPMTMPLPDGKPLENKRLALFKNRIQPMTARLNRSFIASARLSSWVSSPACARSAQLNARLALDPGVAANSTKLGDLLCPVHLPGGITLDRSRVADTQSVARRME